MFYFREGDNSVLSTIIFILRISYSYELIVVCQWSTKYERSVVGWHWIGLAREVAKEAELFSAFQGSKEYFAGSIFIIFIPFSSRYFDSVIPL